MFDVHQSIFDEYGEELDERRVQRYIDGLMEAFAEAPEGQPIVESSGSVGWASLVMELAANYLGETPATMSLLDLEEVLFELVPRKVSTEADSAAEIVEELRAFWRFLDREYGLEQAAEVVEALGEETVAILKRELSDPSNFGMAKSMVMSGKSAGFDMSDPAELEAFLLMHNALVGKHLEAMNLDPPDQMDPEPAEGEFRPGKHPLGATKPKASRKQKRKKRKAQKQARKRNRR